MNEKYYFAYGSNMDRNQMSERCPKAEFVEVVKIPGYRFDLDIEGAATIKNDESSFVQGVLWTINEEDERSLDKCEGVAKSKYERKMITIETIKGTCNALVYISLRGSYQGCIRPDGYMNKILNAAKEFHFEADYIKLLESFPR